MTTELEREIAMFDEVIQYLLKEENRLKGLGKNGSRNTISE